MANHDTPESGAPSALNNPTGRMGIGIISAGKVGAALGSALRAAGHQIIGAYARSEQSRERLAAMLPGVPALRIMQIVERSEMVLLALPDDELAPLVKGLADMHAWQPGQIVVHTAGRYGAGVLAPAQAQGALCLAIHPGMTFTGTSLDVARIVDCPFAITAPAAILPIGHALVAEMGGRSVVVAEGDRGAYHFALSHGANHAVTLVAQAMRVLAHIGITDPGDYLRPLVTASIEGALSSGETLLTGPIVRGDAGTVAEHVAAATELASEDAALADVLSCYLALARATAERARARGVLSAAQAERVQAALTAAEGEPPQH